MSKFDVLSARINQGLTQRELAAQCGVSLTVIQGLEAGRSAHPKQAKAVADHFGVLATDILPPREDVAA